MSATTAAVSPSDSWGFFDRVYCISVDERADRRKEARRQFQKVGLADRVEFLIVKKHPHDNEEGIHESHLECFRRGIAAQAGTMVIFEDDIVFDRFSPEKLADCIRFLSAASACDILFFGCLTSGSRKTENDAVLKVHYRSLTHAYAITRRFAETLLGIPRGHLPYDGLLRSVAGEYYAAYPAFAFQSDSPTDNARRLRIDRFRRLCGGLLRIQKMDEWYHRNRLAVIAVHALLIMLLLWLVFSP